MDDLVRLIANLPGMTANRAVELAAEVPARVLGERRLGRISEGACSDLVVLDRDLRVRLTMLRGVVQFRRRS
jgi:N-acetylglucosamine-6-phosphate deacetylase